tara:strand:- start:258 stop:1397 length:1140 start_codon:yes stop_codon:yes gene_type:complete
MIIIFTGFILKLLIVISQIFFELPLTQTDPAAFHNEAVDFAVHLKNNFLNFGDYEYRSGWFYSIILGIFYFIFGESKILGGALSCIVWFLSAIIFLNILTKLNLKNIQVNFLLLVYTFLFPISFYYTSLMLREVYLLLFVNLIVLGFLNLNTKKNINFINKRKINYSILINMLVLTISSYLLIKFHKAYQIFFLIYFPIIVAMLLINYFKLTSYIKSYWFLGLIFIIPTLHIFQFLELFFFKIVNYQTGHFSNNWMFRADYYTRPELINLDYSLINFFLHIFKNIFNYLFQPTILKITSLKDLILFFENLLRVIIIIIIVLKTFNNSKKDLIYYLFLSMFFMMEFVYSQATINWGGASRHHVPVIGLMLILLYYPKKVK